MKKENGSDCSRIFHIKKNGCTPIAYHALQSDLESFSIGEIGFIPYKKVRNTLIVPGDPICPPDKTEAILSDFINYNSNCCFIQTSKATAQVLADKGFYVNRFGVETSLSLPYRISGNNRSDIRLLYNAGIKNEIEIKEIFDRQGFHQTVAKLSRNEPKYKREFSFLARPFENKNEEDVRIFAGYHESLLCGFSMFDPIYKAGRLYGYGETISKRFKGSVKGTRVYILLKAAEIFSTEGIKELNLGLSPFYKTNEDNSFNSSQLVNMLFRLMYNYGDRFYNFKGLSFHKSRFCGNEKEVYFASRQKRPLILLSDIYKMITGRRLPTI